MPWELLKNACTSFVGTDGSGNLIDTCFKVGSSAITTVAAVAAACVGIFTYVRSVNNQRRAEEWKRSEAAAAYLKPIFEDPECVFALRCIDYGDDVPLPLPDSLKKIIKFDFITHRHALFSWSLETDMEAFYNAYEHDRDSFNQGMVYRLAIDALLTRIEWIANRALPHSGLSSYIDPLISPDQLPDISYWLRALSCWRWNEDEVIKGRVPESVFERRRMVFVDYADYVGHSGVLRLMKAFNLPDNTHVSISGGASTDSPSLRGAVCTSERECSECPWRKLKKAY